VIDSSLGGLSVRLLIRFLLLVGLLVSATTVAPVAMADDAPSPSAAPASSSTSPSASASSSSTSPSSSASSDQPASSPSSSGSAATSTAAAKTSASTSDSSLVATITSQPSNPSTSHQATFYYSANRPGVTFWCTLSGPGISEKAAVPVTCPVDDTTSTTTGHVTYKGLSSSRTAYRFTVEPRTTAGTGEVVGTSDTYRWRIFTVYAPAHFSLHNGPSFNRPGGSNAQRRVNLNRVIRTIRSMPGYAEAYPGRCPTDSALIPGSIKISSYSLTDRTFARAVVAASRRCISVQVLMNSHLNRKTDPAWRIMEDGLGTKTVKNGAPAASFAHRCHSACRGSGVMHTKMFLFNSTLPDTSQNTYRNIVMFGSTNMTSNAAHVQYNDLYVQRGRSALYSQFANMFDLMKADNGWHRNPTLSAAGAYQATFWPLAKSSTVDPYVRAFRSVSCSGATGGTGINGHTVVYVNMHAWFGTRGLALAKQVRSLYNKGCYVRVLYSFMSYTVFKQLHTGTGSRMSVRRTLFSHNGKTAYVYSHFKNIDVSGHVGSDTSAKVVWTGSNNFTNSGTKFDEVNVRIASRSTYNAYVKQFHWISKHKSSTVYANYSEPSGGGRAP